MSSFVTRPPSPVPGTRERSTLWSLAILRTSGDDFCFCPSAALSGTAGACGATAAGAGTGAEAATGAGGAAATAAGAMGATGATGGAGAATAAPASPITATTEFTGTVSPSFARISTSTPADGDGISASTLSVEISNSGSSRSTRSPTFLIHRTMVPSAIDSPIWGITTSDMARLV